MAVPNNAIQLAAIPRFVHPRRVRRRCDRRFVELRRSRRCVPPLIRQAVPARGNAYAHKLAVALTGWRRAPEKRPGVRTRRGRQESALRHGVGREGDVVFSGVGLGIRTRFAVNGQVIAVFKSRGADLGYGGGDVDGG